MVSESSLGCHEYNAKCPTLEEMIVPIRRNIQDGSSLAVAGDSGRHHRPARKGNIYLVHFTDDRNSFAVGQSIEYPALSLLANQHTQRHAGVERRHKTVGGRRCRGNQT